MTLKVFGIDKSLMTKVSTLYSHLGDGIENIEIFDGDEPGTFRLEVHISRYADVSNVTVRQDEIILYIEMVNIRCELLKYTAILDLPIDFYSVVEIL